MTRTLNKILALVISAALLSFTVPSVALAADGNGAAPDQGTLVEDLSMGSFDGSGHGYTDVSILTMRTDFHIVTQSPTWTADDADADIWVQVTGGVGPYEVSWWRQLLDASGNPWGDPELVVDAQADPSTDPDAVFRLMPADLKARSEYHYWAQVTDLNPAGDVSTASNEDDPILVINRGGYRAGPLIWPDVPNWTWSVEGFIRAEDGTTNGATGAIYNKAVLDADELDDVSPCRQRLQQAASDAGYSVQDAWRLLIANTDEDVRAFIDTILVRLDVTAYVQDILDDASLHPSQKQQAIAQMVSVWHLADPTQGDPRRITSEAPDKLNIYIQEGADGTLRAYASFFMDDDPYGASGDLGCFAVALKDSDMHVVTVVTPSHGQVAPAGKTRYEAGAEPVFMLYPDPGYRVSRVLANGQPLSDESVGANWCKLPPLEGDVTLSVEYALATSTVDPVPETFKVGVRVQASDDDGGASTVVLRAHGVQAGPFTTGGAVADAADMPAMKPLLLEFDPASGFAPASVKITYEDGTVDEYRCCGNALTIPALLGPANVEVFFEAAIAEPEVLHQVSIEVTTAGAHLVARAPATQPTSYGGCASFALQVEPGYTLQSIQVTRNGVPVEDSAAVYEQDGQDATLYLYNVITDVHAKLAYEGEPKKDPTPGTDDKDPTPGTDDEASYHMLNVTVVGGHGSASIDGDNYYDQLQAKVKHGTRPTLHLRRDMGYEIYRVQVDGQQVPAGQTSVTLPAVTADTEVQVEFRKTAAAGSNSAATRALRTLQALAKTGDLAAPVALALLSIASGSVGAVFLLASRRRERDCEQDAEQAPAVG